VKAPRKFLNADARKKLFAKSALVSVIVDELMVHGCARLPKFRRAREITRNRRLINRSLRRTVARARADQPEDC
jgi:dihydroxyacetone kinase-like predicted kinase